MLAPATAASQTQPVVAPTAAPQTPTTGAVATARGGPRKIVLELCCGAAGYTAAVREYGVEAVGVDFDRNQSRPTAPCLRVDLSSEAGQQLL